MRGSVCNNISPTSSSEKASHATHAPNGSQRRHHCALRRHSRRRRRPGQSVRQAQHAALPGAAVRQDQGQRLPAGLRAGHAGTVGGDPGDRRQSRSAHVREHDRRHGEVGAHARPGLGGLQRGGPGQHRRRARPRPGRGDAEARRASRRHLHEPEAVRPGQGDLRRTRQAQTRPGIADAARGLPRRLRACRRRPLRRRPGAVARHQQGRGDARDGVRAEAHRRHEGRAFVTDKRRTWRG